MPLDPSPLAIAALVRDDERDLLLAAANRLSLCLGEEERGLPIALHLAQPGAPGSAAALVASLRIDEDAIGVGGAALAERWRARLAGWEGKAVLVNVFRHVADPDRRDTLAPHLRRLDLLAIELSRETGAVIADVDRAFALVGGATLGTDHRCAGALAHEIAAYAIVAALLALDLGASPERVDRARARNGGPETPAAIVGAHERRAA